MNNLKIGDKVLFRNVALGMVVKEIIGSKVCCTWKDEQGKHEKEFDEWDLTTYMTISELHEDLL